MLGEEDDGSVIKIRHTIRRAEKRRHKDTDEEEATDEESHVVDRRAPVMLDQIKYDPGKDCWESLKRFRLCLHGANCGELLQAGDLIRTLRNVGRVLYMAYALNGHTVMVTYERAVQLKDLNPELRPFVKTSTEWIPVIDQVFTVTLGETRLLCKKDDLQLSPFILENDHLRVKPVETLPTVYLDKLRTLLMETYATCDRKKLEAHPLVRFAAQNVSVLMRPVQMALLIRHKFHPICIRFDEDVANTASEDFFVPKHSLPGMNGVCVFCRRDTELLYREKDTVEVCEPCYMRLRKWYRIFTALESGDPEDAEEAVPALNEALMAFT